MIRTNILSISVVVICFLGLSSCSGKMETPSENGGGHAYKTVFKWGKPIDIFGFQPQQRYAYCPSALEMEDGTCHVFFCGNPNPGIMIDNVFHLTVNPDGSVSEPMSVLQPSAGSWDSFHCCDPNVVEGKFRMNGVDYRYAMFYLGSDKGDTNGNELGVAFSNNLSGKDWVKYPYPLVPFTGDADKYWGVGQASAFSLDKKGKLILTYSCGDERGTRVMLCEADLSDMSNPVLTTAVTLSSMGFNHLIHNCDFAYDPLAKKVVGAFSGDWAKNYPTFIETFVAVANMNYDTFVQGKGIWTRLPDIDSELTGFYRNHNPCVLRDSFGHLKNYKTPSVFYTISITGNPCEWSYRMYRTDGILEKQEIIQ